jgi:hypothetical protein
MSRSGLLTLSVLTILAGWSGVFAASPPARAADVDQSSREALNTYCANCHNQHSKVGRDTGIAFDSMDSTDVSHDAERWEKVVRRLRTGAMPPQGARRPDQATYDRLISGLELALDRAAQGHPNPGRARLRRLNRAEYANAVRDLLALDVDVASLLPPDDSAYGFDNISDVLGVSPSLQEHYLSAAAKISALAVGDPDIGPRSETYRIRQDLSQNQHIEGLPLGTMGGTSVRQNFPLDGDYVFQIKFFRTNLGMMRGLEYPHDIEYTVDGRRVHVATIGGNADLAAAFDAPTLTADAMEQRFRVRVPVKAGAHEVSVAFVEDLPALDTTRLQPFIRSSFDTLDWIGRPHIDMFSITGPFNASGPGDQQSRRQIFTCHPANAGVEASCAKQIVSSLMRRAFRGPATAVDIQRAMDAYTVGRRTGSFEKGIQTAIQYVLASPKFVFRSEETRPNAVRTAIYRLSDVELASSLSFFLWSSVPDETLLTAAAHGELSTSRELEQQVRRMLEDSKSGAIVANFAGQWLQLRNVRTIAPNSELFPDFDDNLRQAFRRETELFFESIVRGDRNVLDLLRADYTFVNERLAKHYGIPGIYGSHFRRVAITDDARKGLLGQGSVLAITSKAERTSPVVRGKWILENILGTPPAPPPPDVPALKDAGEDQKPKTMREQMAEHRANPVCASCHKVMDPIGFALENFDAVGAWRTHDAGATIDASGELADGTVVNGVSAVRAALLRRPDVFVGTLTEKLLTYALGRGLDYHDMPAVRAIVRDAAADNYRFSSIVLGIVKSAPFQNRLSPMPSAAH